MSKKGAAFLFLIVLGGAGVVFWVNELPSIGLPLIGGAAGALLGAVIRSRTAKRRD
ncbi:hypothetical protein ACFORH_14155 [Amycolatopsis roodepoortensis]|uniref:XapX domain-containing protein n=1 Tax=Amycolatopsis roodepoortensis TaxID=700274 RepID=A0ABR9KYP3_9PSEU|nr:hypothetical protein [Amycolatopsis roodepoortensis]MBE1573489.1 hypothetical protein [Amycolatopsis roodepoortensis]